MSKWKEIEDDNILHKWLAECDCEDDNISEVPPDWYQDNGTPVCAFCGVDSKYISTSIKVD